VYVPTDEPIDPTIARPAVAIPDQVLHLVARLAGQLNISARAATSQCMTDFINTVIATTLRFAEDHPDHAWETAQIFRPVSDKTLTDKMIAESGQLIDAQIAALKNRYVTIQMDAGTVLRLHFLNFVVSAPGFEPFLYQAEVRETFTALDYSAITPMLSPDCCAKAFSSPLLRRIICLRNRLDSAS
jgi:hypothetical protein